MTTYSQIGDKISTGLLSGIISRFDGTKGWLWSDTGCQERLNYICQHSEFLNYLIGVTRFVVTTKLKSIIHDTDTGVRATLSIPQIMDLEQ